MTRTFVDIHVLQTVPPSNINRDDTGSPKTAVFGGVRRARVSSQAWKRATRLAFDDLLDRKDLGVRTKRVVDVVAAAIVAQRADLTEQAPMLAEGIVRSTGLNVTVPKPKKGAETAGPAETDFLVFVSQQQIDLLARTAIELAAEEDPAAALKALKGKKLLDQAHSVDLALFGRMVANDTDLNVDASAQVAHAISVHAVDNEYDYFTAVDDVKSKQTGEDAGAGMIGTVEFNSSTLYRYATVDVDHLRASLGDDEATRRAVEAFVTAFVQSMPTGKQNTFANRTLPDAVLVAVRDTQPVNLVGAFEDAVVAEDGKTRLEVAGARLAERAAEVSSVLGHVPVATWQVAVGAARTGLESVAEHTAEPSTLPALPTAAGALVLERLGASR